MNNCVVRVFGPAVAKTTVPRLLVTRTGSSRNAGERHLACTSGLELFDDMKNDIVKGTEFADVT